jgi:hypothetical protein
MLDHANVKIDLIESKKKIFVHVTLKGRRPVKSGQVRSLLKSLGHDVGALKSKNIVEDKKGLFVFDIGDGLVEKKKSLRDVAIENFNQEEIKKVDLTLSHAGSDLEPAPEVEEKPKTTRRTRKTTSRKPRTRRTTKKPAE